MLKIKCKHQEEKRRYHYDAEYEAGDILYINDFYLSYNLLNRQPVLAVKLAMKRIEDLVNEATSS